MPLGVDGQQQLLLDDVLVLVRRLQTVQIVQMVQMAWYQFLLFFDVWLA